MHTSLVPVLGSFSVKRLSVTIIGAFASPTINDRRAAG
jgi:hypothetical protein